MRSRVKRQKSPVLNEQAKDLRCHCPPPTGYRVALERVIDHDRTLAALGIRPISTATLSDMVAA